MRQEMKKGIRQPASIGYPNQNTNKSILEYSSRSLEVTQWFL